jgi:putative transposase
MGSGRRRTASQPWKTFVRNHAQGIVACDFLVVVTARFRILFVFVALEIGSRRILHCNVTAHPTAEWTLQQLNAYCERLIGTVRRECLDFMIPLHERQLRGTLRSWLAHYNKGRPHSSLGPGTPEPTPMLHLSQLHPRHQLPRDCRITVEDILGGLHHEYQLQKCVV